jgi:hypothetical protein
MAANFKIENRNYRWTGHNRLEYVRKGFPFLWVDATPETATHVLHFWLPDAYSVWHATARKV